ncbi:MAG: DUF305 domain-containing protein [Ilumatobacteraceae bacterium]
MKYRSISIIAAVGVLGLAACGSDKTATPATQQASASDTAAGTPAAGASFNQADVTFAQSMIPHHEQAIEMADMAFDSKVDAGEKVRELASRIKAGQNPEIEMMSGWLGAWGQTMPMDMGPGQDMASMDGMMSTEEMSSLGAMTGPAFDKMWMDMMIRHHEGAISMAQTVKASGSNTDVLALAGQVITAQQGEIAEMNTLLAGG